MMVSMLALSSPPTPRAIARSMVSRVMLFASALSIAARRRGLEPGSPPPSLAAVTSSRMILVKILPRLASCAALRCLVFAHLLCPAMLTFLRSFTGCRLSWLRAYLPSVLSQVSDNLTALRGERCASSSRSGVRRRRRADGEQFRGEDDA